MERSAKQMIPPGSPFSQSALIWDKTDPDKLQIRHIFQFDSNQHRNAESETMITIDMIFKTQLMIVRTLFKLGGSCMLASVETGVSVFVLIFLGEKCARANFYPFRMSVKRPFCWQVSRMVLAVGLEFSDQL